MTQIVTEEEQNNIIEEIMGLLGTKVFPAVLQDYIWLNFPSGIWLVSKTQYRWIQDYIISNHELEKQLAFAGTYLGKKRRIFTLSLESLQLLRKNIEKYVVIKGMKLEKFLYGRNIKVKLQENFLPSTKKVVVLNEEKTPQGIASYQIVEKIDKNTLRVDLKPLVDLGFYLRNEQKTFKV